MYTREGTGAWIEDIGREMAKRQSFQATRCSPNLSDTMHTHAAIQYEHPLLYKNDIKTTPCCVGNRSVNESGFRSWY